MCVRTLSTVLSTTQQTLASLNEHNEDLTVQTRGKI